MLLCVDMDMWGKELQKVLTAWLGGNVIITEIDPIAAALKQNWMVTLFCQW